MSDRRAPGLTSGKGTAALLLLAAGGLMLLSCALQTSGLAATGAGAGGGQGDADTSTSHAATTVASGTGGAATSSSSATGTTTSTSSGSMPMCGNGKVEADEECDDGTMNSDTAACLSNCKKATCGDGHVQMGMEECDDGNTVQGDRCSPTCHVENPETCPGTAISISKGTPVVIHDTTSGSGASDKFQSVPNEGNCPAGSYPGLDLVYAVTPNASGMLKAVLNTSYSNHYVHARKACPGTTQDEINCAYSTKSNVDDSISFTVNSGTKYYVIADSWQNQSGPFTLTLTLQ